MTPILADATSTVGTSLSGWLTSITGALSEFSVDNVITILVAIFAITVPFAIFWFAYRLVTRKVSKAMRKGKI